VPQGQSHYEVVESDIPSRVIYIAGCTAFSIGSYYSENYSEMGSAEYR